MELLLRASLSQPVQGAIVFPLPTLRKEAALDEYQQRKTTAKPLPTTKYFRILPISNILPEHILETRSKPSQGFRPYYLNRPYLNDRLLYNYRQCRHTIVTGKPLAGKSRAVLELCHALKEENVEVWFPQRMDFQMEDFHLPDTNAEVILFFDDLEQFLHLENLDLALEMALQRPNLRVVATCRKSELRKVEERLTDLLPNFDVLEIQNLNSEEEDFVERHRARSLRNQMAPAGFGL
ncbi:MAG: hypothetical protein IPM82_18430 [Saprospiraceae bacterium]|nr:hypothetical protein [Saprospiraceae bacterium]